MTSIEQLQNLLAIRKLKPEPPDIREFDGLLLTAKRMIPDAELEQLSPHSRFQLAYDAAHSLALAALYEGAFQEDERLISELIAVTKDLLEAVEKLPPIAESS